MSDVVDDPARAERQGQMARYVAEHELSWPRLTRQLEEHYSYIRSGAQMPAMAKVVPDS
jgi:hypothetical protein